MFPFNMVERLWYVVLCLISNSQILLPIYSLSLRDGSGIQARVVGNSNGSTVHIVLQRSTADTVAEKVCPTGFYEHTRPARRTGRSAAAAIVGRSGPRRSTNGGKSKVPTDNEEEEIVPLKLCIPCTVCDPDQIMKKPCTSTQNTLCRTCGINTDFGPCVRYDQVDHVDINLATNPPRNDKASNDVHVTLDFSGKPDGVKPEKPGLASAPQDLNVNILKAGKDERNSWYFLSLCALIGLLVFLSLVMGAYLVSVKVTSWWRYQRPVTVRRRGQSFQAEDNHINLTTFPSSHPHRYNDIINGSREVTRSREVPSREAIKLVRGGPEAVVAPTMEESYPSTSSSTMPNPKIQVVQLRAGSGDFDSLASFDSFVMDGRGFPKARYMDQYYSAGCSWSSNANKDLSDYSSDEDGDDDCGVESGAIFSPSRPSTVLGTVRGKHLYQSLPLSESSSSNDTGCKVHIVQWPSVVRMGHRSSFQVCMNGESGEHYHSAPSQRSADDLHRGFPHVKHKTSVSESSNCSNTFPKNYHPLMNLKREKNYDPHSVCTTQEMMMTNGATSLDSSPHCPMGSSPLKRGHHSQPFIGNGDLSHKHSPAALPVAGGVKYNHQRNHPPQRTEWDDRGSDHQACQNFHEHRSQNDKNHSYPPTGPAAVALNETKEPNNDSTLEGPTLNGYCVLHPSLDEEDINRHDDNISETTTSYTNHNTADDKPLGAQLQFMS